MSHIPVLLEDVLKYVNEIEVRDGVFLDGTFGRGGHTREILRIRPDMRVIALDCDDEAIEYGRQTFTADLNSGRLEIHHGNYSDFKKFIPNGQMLSGALLDLGVSSPQLDEGRRGFSFYHDGPLDMRMDRSAPQTAADVVNNWGEDELNDLFIEWGEVRSPFRVTKKIIEARNKRLFSTTGELSALIENAEGWRKKGHHPATNYFLALRLTVNDELGRVQKVLEPLVGAMALGGRALIITFHSLEDRIVKVAFKKIAEANQGYAVNKKVIQADWAATKENPRARSAKLRVFERSNEKKNEIIHKMKHKTDEQHGDDE